MTTSDPIAIILGDVFIPRTVSFRVGNIVFLKGLPTIACVIASRLMFYWSIVRDVHVSENKKTTRRRGTCRSPHLQAEGPENYPNIQDEMKAVPRLRVKLALSFLWIL